MSTTIPSPSPSPTPPPVQQSSPIAEDGPNARSHKKYRGFAAGVFSGMAKLTVGHPFDTIKVRMQTAPASQFAGPLDCLLKTVRHEGARGVYKGATPPLVGWMAMDSLMLGSLTHYRALIKAHIFPRHETLPPLGHAFAGIFAGWTVSFLAAPIEHVKSRLQVQYHGRAPRGGVASPSSTPIALPTSNTSTPTSPVAAATAIKPRYSGPLNCAASLLRTHGIRGLFHGLSATLIFRTFFFFWWGSYDILSRALAAHTSLSTPAVNFWAGGLSAQVFWLTSYPSDVVKQRIMTDDLDNRRYRNWGDAVRQAYREGGVRTFWRGFLPAFLRAFPANAAALVAFESVMRALP